MILPQTWSMKLITSCGAGFPYISPREIMWAMSVRVRGSGIAFVRLCMCVLALKDQDGKSSRPLGDL